MGEHAAVVGAVTHGDRIGFGNPQQPLKAHQHVPFREVEHHVAADQTRQTAVPGVQDI